MKQFGINVGGVVSGLTKFSALTAAASMVAHVAGSLYAITSGSFEACGDDMCPSLGAAKVALSVGAFVLCMGVYSSVTNNGGTTSPVEPYPPKLIS